MTTVSIFVDESGEQGFQSRYYAVTLVFHDQSNPVLPSFTKYERVLRGMMIMNYSRSVNANGCSAIFSSCRNH